MAWLTNSEYQAIGRKLDAVSKQLDALQKQLIAQGTANMATKAEVKADLDAIKAEVTATRGAADSAIALLNKVLGTIKDAAASATDLDGFRADLADIMSGTKATEDELKAAVTANPQT